MRRVALIFVFSILIFQFASLGSYTKFYASAQAEDGPNTKAAKAYKAKLQGEILRIESKLADETLPEDKKNELLLEKASLENKIDKLEKGIALGEDVAGTVLRTLKIPVDLAKISGAAIALLAAAIEDVLQIIAGDKKIPVETLLKTLQFYEEAARALGEDENADKIQKVRELIESLKNALDKVENVKKVKDALEGLKDILSSKLSLISAPQGDILLANLRSANIGQELQFHFTSVDVQFLRNELTLPSNLGGNIIHPELQQIFMQLEVTDVTEEGVHFDITMLDVQAEPFMVMGLSSGQIHSSLVDGNGILTEDELFAQAMVNINSETFGELFQMENHIGNISTEPNQLLIDMSGKIVTKSVVGGEQLSLDNKALLVAGLQTNLAWIVPVALAILGIGLFAFSRKTQ